VVSLFYVFCLLAYHKRTPSSTINGTDWPSLLKSFHHELGTGNIFVGTAARYPLLASGQGSTTSPSAEIIDSALRMLTSSHFHVGLMSKAELTCLKGDTSKLTNMDKINLSQSMVDEHPAVFGNVLRRKQNQFNG